MRKKNAVWQQIDSVSSINFVTMQELQKLLALCVNLHTLTFKNR